MSRKRRQEPRVECREISYQQVPRSVRSWFARFQCALQVSHSRWSNKTMTRVLRASVLVLTTTAGLVSDANAQGVNIWTVGVDNTRQGWNKFETVLTPATVPKLKKIREFT